MTLGLCSQIELDLAVERASVRRDRMIKKVERKGDSLKPIDDSPATEETVDEAEES